MNCVNQTTGEVMPNLLSHLKNWKKDNTLESLLKAIRKEMETPSFKSLKQPAEGTTF